jgi:hypothetical protein
MKADQMLTSLAAIDETRRVLREIAGHAIFELALSGIASRQKAPAGHLLNKDALGIHADGFHILYVEEPV